MNETFKIEGYDFNFRVKELNAIDAFALRLQLKFNDYETAKRATALILSNLEVEIKGNWLPVKEGDSYYPVEIANDANAIDELCSKFLISFSKVFQSSKKSDKEQI